MMTDSILDLIDGALRDAVSADAMRWHPDARSDADPVVDGVPVNHWSHWNRCVTGFGAECWSDPT